MIFRVSILFSAFDYTAYLTFLQSYKSQVRKGNLNSLIKYNKQMSQSNSLANLLAKYTSQPTDKFLDDYKEEQVQKQYHDERNEQENNRLESLSERMNKYKTKSSISHNKGSDDQLYHFQSNSEFDAESDQDLEQYYDLLLNGALQNNIQANLKSKEPNKYQERPQTSSARKIFTPKVEKQKKNKRKNKKKDNPLFIHPENSLNYMKQQTVSIIKNQIESMTEHTEQKSKYNERLNDQMQRLGMKSSKNIGSVRSKNELSNVLAYLTSGQVPGQYIKKLEALILG